MFLNIDKRNKTLDFELITRRSLVQILPLHPDEVLENTVFQGFFFLTNIWYFNDLRQFLRQMYKYWMSYRSLKSTPMDTYFFIQIINTTIIRQKKNCSKFLYYRWYYPNIFLFYRLYRDRRKFCVKVNKRHPFRQVLDI